MAQKQLMTTVAQSRNLLPHKTPNLNALPGIRIKGERVYIINDWFNDELIHGVYYVFNNELGRFYVYPDGSGFLDRDPDFWGSWFAGIK